MRGRKLYVAMAVCLVGYLVFHEGEITHGPGIMAPEPPLQEKVSDRQDFTHDDFTITSLALFQATARVLSKENYRFGTAAELSPVDLALGWGRMSDERVLEKLSISQSNRWYRWRTKEPPIPQREIEVSSANMHLIPSTQEIRNTLKKVKKGDIVEFKGSLVKVVGDENWEWGSSLTRTDTGSRSCELVWVEEFTIQ